MGARAGELGAQGAGGARGLSMAIGVCPAVPIVSGAQLCGGPCKGLSRRAGTARECSLKRSLAALALPETMQAKKGHTAGSPRAAQAGQGPPPQPPPAAALPPPPLSCQPAGVFSTASGRSLGQPSAEQLEAALQVLAAAPALPGAAAAPGAPPTTSPGASPVAPELLPVGADWPLVTLVTPDGLQTHAVPPIAAEQAAAAGVRLCVCWPCGSHLSAF